MRLVSVFLASALLAAAQPYDLLLEGGHVLDPANGIDAVSDVALSGGRIAAVRARIDPASARQVLDVTGLYVVPGFVDLHTHVFGYAGVLDPDDSSLPTGVTTAVDAGGSGWRTFDKFRDSVIARSRTRVLALLNIVGAGMVGEPAESNTADMDSEAAARTIARHRDVIVGIKTAHFAGKGWTAIDHAVAAGRIAGVPVMVDDRIFTGTGRTTGEELLQHLRPGDIHTHMYNDRQIELVNRFTGKVQPYMLEARRRGVRFDLGHGAGSFLWPVATKAMAQGFLPDTISTDLHAQSILGPQPDMPNCISKLMLLGMSLPDAILRSTANPAKAIGRYPALGTLGVGRTADIAVLALETGVFAFKDSWGAKMLGTRRLENVFTIRNGAVAWQREGGAPRSPADTAIYDILLKHGHVVDPANRRDGRMDIAIVGDRIARVAADLPAAHARIAIDAGACYVTPGLVDTEARSAADYNNLPYGVTTAVVVPHPAAALLSRANALLRSGQPVPRIVERFTVDPARALRRPGIGSLAEGGPADVALLEVEQATGGQRLRCLLTIRHGAIVWDSDALSAPDWVKAGPYSNFK